MQSQYLLAAAVATLVCPVISDPGSCAAQEKAYFFQNDVITVEAEDMVHGDIWKLETDRSGFTGSGYLRYTGPERLGTDGQDHTGAAQGSEDEWIRIPIFVERLAAHHVNIRAHHRLKPPPEEGGAAGLDCSVWTHVVGYDLPVTLSHADSPDRWEWLVYGPGANGDRDLMTVQVSFRLEPGVHTVYVAGRSTDFRADRISIYPRLGPTAYPDLAHSTTAPLSELKPVPASTGIHGNSPSISPNSMSVRNLPSLSTGTVLTLDGRLLTAVRGMPDILQPPRIHSAAPGPRIKMTGTQTSTVEVPQ